MIDALSPELEAGIEAFLALRSDWDRKRVFDSALSLFLLQNRTENQQSDRAISRIYLDSLFKIPDDLMEAS